MQATFTHAAAGVEHGKSEILPKQFTLKQNEEAKCGTLLKNRVWYKENLEEDN